MSEYEQIEHLRGTGSVVSDNGSGVGDAAYEFSVYHKTLDASSTGGHKEEVEGPKEIDGVIRGLDNIQLLGTPLTLKLPDGRLLDFFISDGEGSITSRGKGLYRADDD